MLSCSYINLRISFSSKKSRYHLLENSVLNTGPQLWAFHGGFNLHCPWRRLPFFMIAGHLDTLFNKIFREVICMLFVYLCMVMWCVCKSLDTNGGWWRACMSGLPPYATCVWRIGLSQAWWQALLAGPFLRPCPFACFLLGYLHFCHCGFPLAIYSGFESCIRSPSTL